MMRLGLPALVITALAAGSVLPTLAQGAGKKASSPQRATKSAPQPSGVAAKVNDKVLTWDQLIARVQSQSMDVFNQSLAQAVGPRLGASLFGPGSAGRFTITRSEALAALRKQPPQAFAMELQNMIREEILNQESTRAGVKVADSQVKGYIDRLFKSLRKQNRIPPGVTDDQFLAQNQMTRVKLMTIMRPMVQAGALIERDYARKNGHPFGPDDFIQARHILISTGPTPGAPPTETDPKKREEQALTTVTRIAEEITSGKKSFEDAAKESSQDNGSKGNGGDLGPSVRGMMVPEFDKAAFALKSGEISMPVKTQFGYHLIKLIKSGKDLTEEERQMALDTFKQGKFQELLTGLQQKARIQNNLPAAGPMGMMPSGGGPR